MPSPGRSGQVIGLSPAAPSDDFPLPDFPFVQNVRDIGSMPLSERFIAEVNISIQRGCDRTVFALIELKDVERLYVFDPSAAKSTLSAFAKKIRQVIGEKYPFAHLSRGGFGLWFSGCDEEAARRELDTIVYVLQGELETPDCSLLPEISLKIGVFPDDGEDADALLAKTAISGSCMGPGLPSPQRSSTEARKLYSLEQDLRHAVERQELTLLFQPIIDLEHGRMVAAEALIRWRHPSLGPIAPATFIPLLEQMGLINEFGMWSLNTACAALRAWRDNGSEHLSIAVNLSAKQLEDPTLVTAVERALARHDLPPNLLTLELTETAAMQNADRTMPLFHQLKDVGVNLSIDDFGTGYSSLSYLLKLPFDKLKIDREFVVGVHWNAQGRAICRSLVELAKGLQIGLVAEGAETVDEVQTLQDVGCQFVQGFYFSRPVTAEQIAASGSENFWQGPTIAKLPALHLAIARN